MFNLLKILFKKNNKKMIFLTFYDLSLGGIQTRIIDIANELSKDDNLKVVVFLGEKKKFDRFIFLSKKVITIYCPQFMKFLIKARYYYLLVFLLFIFRPHSILLFLENTSLFVIKWVKKLKIPTKIIISVATFLNNDQTHSDQDIRKQFNKADSVLAVSKATHNDLKNRIKISSPPLLYAPNWTKKHSHKIRSYAERENDIVFLGRFDLQKQPNLILKFAQILKEKKLKSKIKMYGFGFLKKELIKEIRINNLQKMVKIYPAIKDPYQILLNSKFIILTSKFEGLPLVLLEAMSAGSVILSLKAPGVTELVVDGKVGICKKSVSELANSYINICKEKGNKFYYDLQKEANLYQKKNYSKNNLEKVVNILC